MKKSIYGLVFFTSIILTACAQSRNIQEEGYVDEPSNSISYQQFYDDLSPYGRWIDNPEFGNVWIPGEGRSFRPYYSNGNWAYTNYGWTWVSNYNWGWATFHYGRWFYDDFYGWMWVPGYEWAPAWVNWRGNSQYYGWAPLCPRRSNGRYYEVPNDQWAFIPQQYLNRRDLNNYYVNRQNNITIINNTTVINNTPVRTFKNVPEYQAGPKITEVEKVTRTRIKPLAIKQSNQPGNPQVANGALRIYKPVVKPGNNAAVGSTQTINQPAKNSDNKIVSPDTRAVKKLSNGDNSINTNGSNVKVDNVNNDALNNDPRTKANPKADNNDKPLNNADRKLRDLRDQQIQRTQTDQPQQNQVAAPDKSSQVKEIPRQNPVNNSLPEKKELPARTEQPINDNQQQKINNRQFNQNTRVDNNQDNRINNNIRQRRDIPIGNDQPRNNQPRVMNERQQNPAINQNQFNQRQLKERPASNFERPSGTVEKRYPAESSPLNKAQGKVNR